jgi:hypothetical protein
MITMIFPPYPWQRVQVVSPDLLWLQLSSDLEGDLKSISTLIANHRLKPLKNVRVCLHLQPDGYGCVIINDSSLIPRHPDLFQHSHVLKKSGRL